MRKQIHKQDTKKQLLSFLQRQKFLVLATVDAEGKPWIANLYYSVNANFEFFFVSPTNTKHSQHLKNNSEVAFSTVWYNKNDLSDRKGIQAVGVCNLVTNPVKIAGYLKTHHKYFPSWKEVINLKNILGKVIESRPYVIKPKYIKYWDDKLLGEEGIEEFNF